jgi:hypothetical protein
MKSPPQRADGANVLAAAELTGLASSDACVFRRNGVLQTGFAGLLIARYADDHSCYLFYCDEAWTVQNDTLHESLHEAKEFAERQYPGVSDRWKPVE